MSFNVATLTVSDTASRDVSADKSGPTAREILSQNGFRVVIQQILPDDDEVVRTCVREWCERGDISWVITTGGTGFGLRDRTPEAIEPLITRKAPGIVHLLLSTSLQHTPFASLSRPVAGTYRNTLITTLPGSVNAVKECLGSLLSNGVVKHALELLGGGSGEGVHREMGGSNGSTTTAATTPLGGGTNSSSRSGTPAQSGLLHHVEHNRRHDHYHQHHHGHHLQRHGEGGHVPPKPRTILSHDPAQPVHARLRVSPYPLISFEQALDTIKRNTTRLEVINLAFTPSLSGHVLAEDIYSTQNIPEYPTSNVDGYALRASTIPGVYNVLTPQLHPLNKSTPVPEGSIFRINTGAPLPTGTDSVIMVEDTQLVSTRKVELGVSIPPRDSESEMDVEVEFQLEGEEEEDAVQTLAQVELGENVRKPGSDVRKGDLVLNAGTVLRGTGGEVGTLAFVGRKEAKVYRKPVVALLSTGDELVNLQSHISEGEGFHEGRQFRGIWDCNRPSLQAALTSLGYEVVDLGIVKDTVQAHINSLQSGLSQADIIVTTGGTSMGVTDLFKPVIERHLNGTIHFGRVTVKPGKPTTFATIPTAQSDGSTVDKPLFALPGNPASALVTFYLFVMPALRQLGGFPEKECHLPRVRVQVEDAMPLDSRTEFHRVHIRASPGGLRASSTGGQRSSRVASLSGANGLVILPQKKIDGPTHLHAGEYAEAVVIGEIQWE